MIRYHPKVFVDIVAAAHRSIPIVALLPGKADIAGASSLLRKHGLGPEAVRYAVMPMDSMWIRDYGPVFVRRADGSLSIADGQYVYVDEAAKPRLRDDAVPKLFGRSLGLPVITLPLDFDGGNLLTNGEGLCVTTGTVVTHNFRGGLQQGRKAVAETLRGTFGFRQWVLLKVLKDEPTGHVDMFVTFVARNIAVVGQCDPAVDPVNAGIMDEAAMLLTGVPTSRGPMRVYRIPVPPRSGEYWRSYNNVVFANGTLLMPTFQGVDPALQERALSLYARLMPGWKVVGIKADSLVPKMGLLHCVCLNLPSYVSLKGLATPRARSRTDAAQRPGTGTRLQ